MPAPHTPTVAVAWAAALLLLGCAGDKTPPPEPEQESSLWRGDRENSPSRRTSEERPKPWEEQTSPLGTDRMALDELADRRRRRHAEAHSRQDLRLESFSHPACDALRPEQRKGCPMLFPGWTKMREVEGGIALEAPSVPPNYRMQLLCHIAFGAAGSGETSCPLHVPGVRARLATDPRGTTLVLTAPPSQLEELRRRVQQLF